MAAKDAGEGRGVLTCPVCGQDCEGPEEGGARPCLACVVQRLYEEGLRKKRKGDGTWRYARTG